jgi:hypothetical protein
MDGFAVAKVSGQRTQDRRRRQIHFGANELTRLRQGYGVVRNEQTYLGAREATIFSKRGSPRSGSQ